MRSHVLAVPLAAALVVGTAGVAASQAQTFTSPYGLDTTEGNSFHDYILFTYDKMRWQQMDSTSIGTGVKVMRSIAWRRDGTSTSRAAWTARTLNMAVLLADSQPVAATSTNFDTNYLKPPTTVFTMKQVNLPDWSVLPTTTPAPFDVKLTFDVPWVYFANNAFLWEVRADNNSGVRTNYGNDFQTQSGTLTYGTNMGTVTGPGCTATGQGSPYQLACTIANYKTHLRLEAVATAGPANAPAVMHLDVTNPNMAVPGLCANVLAFPRVVLPLGTSSPTGESRLFVDNIALDPAVVGASLFLQAAALDAGQAGLPIALSSGRHNVVPPTPNPPGTSRIYEYWITTSMRAPSSWTGGLITQFEY